MCKFTKIEKMLLTTNGAINEYYIGNDSAMELFTPKYYMYMEKVSSGILVKVRYHEMGTYFVNMVVKNQDQVINLITGYILEIEREQPTQDQPCEIVSCEHGMTKQYMSEKAHKVANEFNKAIVKLETLLSNADTLNYDLTETCELNLKLMRKTQQELKDTLMYFTMNNKKATMEYHFDCIEYFEWLLNEKYLANIKGIENALNEQPTQEQSCGVVSCEQPTQEPQENVDTPMDFDFDFDCECEYCGSKENVEFRQRTLWGKYAFMCERCLKEPH